MKWIKALGLTLLATVALSAMATSFVEAGPAAGGTPLPGNEGWALIAVSAVALGAAALLRIGKSPQFGPNTSLARCAETASVTDQFAVKAMKTTSPQLTDSAFTTRELSTTASEDAIDQQAAGFENQIPNPQNDRRTWTNNLILAC